MKILIDADLLLEALLNRDGLTAEAEKLWNFLESKPARPELSKVYITDFALEKINLMTKTLAGVEAAETVNSTIRKLVSIYSIDRTIIEQARSLRLTDFETAIEVVCALKMSAKAIVTHSSFFDEKEGESMVSLSIWSVEKLINECNILYNLQETYKAKTVENRKQLIEESDYKENTTGFQNSSTCLASIPPSSSHLQTTPNNEEVGQLNSDIAIARHKQDEKKKIDEQLAQQIKLNREEFDAQFAELMSSNNSDGRILFAFTRRLLMQFKKKGAYSEAYIINEAYIRGVKLINKRVTIRKFSPWLKGTIYNIVRELSRGEKRENLAEFNEEIHYQTQYSLIAEEDLNHELHLIRLAYEMLDANDKQLLNLKIVERRTWREISAILRAKGGKTPSESALRKRKERALANLRKLYHEVKESLKETSN